MSWFSGARARLHLLFAPGAAESRVSEEVSFHIEMETAVARRTREIGVRVALGASRRRVLTAIFRRPLTQVCIGVAAGGAVVGATALVLSGGGLSVRHIAMLVAYAAFMLAVCLLACIVPTRRAFRVEPTVALRAE